MPTVTTKRDGEEQSVEVTAWGNRTKVPFQDGKSVAYYLKQANVTGLSSNQVIIKLNGQKVPFMSLATVRRPGSTIVVVFKSQQR